MVAATAPAIHQLPTTTAPPTAGESHRTTPAPPSHPGAGVHLHIQRLAVFLPTVDLDDLVRDACERIKDYENLFTPTKVTPPSNHTIATITACLHQCAREFTREGREEEARADAASFIPHADCLSRDRESRPQYRSLDDLIRARHQSNAPDRFNEHRWAAFASKTPHSRQLHTVATEGAQIYAPTPFEPSPSPQKPRNLQLRLGDCILQHIMKMHRKGAALIFDPDTMHPGDIEQLSFIDIHWVPKPSSDDRPGQPPRHPEGRMCGDPSNVASGTNLNSPAALALCKEAYPPYTLPTIITILRSWHAHARQAGFPMSEGKMWKDDVTNAFGQLNLDPQSARRSAFRVWVSQAARDRAQAHGLILPATLIVVHLWCYFGWCGASLAFNLFTDLLNAHIAPAIKGVNAFYVDDNNGFSNPLTASTDQHTAQQLTRAILGPHAIAPKTVRPTSEAEIIGWLVNLQHMTVLPNAKGCRKLLWSFFTVDTTAKKWPLQQCQLLASLAVRYSLAIRGAIMFVFPFEQMLRGASPAPRTVTSSARFAVEVWRVIAVMLLTQPQTLATSIYQLIDAPGDNVVYSFARTDAGPERLGVAIFTPDGATELLHCSYVLPFTSLARDPAYQNFREFTGVLLAQLLIRLHHKQLCIPPAHSVTMTWSGDNTAALQWAHDNKCKSESTQRAFMAFTWMQLAGRVLIRDTQQLKSGAMGDIDALSRNRAITTLNPHLAVDTSTNNHLNELFIALDPTRTVHTCTDHHAALRTIHSLLQKLFIDIQF